MLIGFKTINFVNTSKENVYHKKGACDILGTFTF